MPIATDDKRMFTTVFGIGKEPARHASPNAKNSALPGTLIEVVYNYRILDQTNRRLTVRFVISRLERLSGESNQN